MCASVRKVPTKVATLARRRSPGGCAVKLNREQGQRLLQERGIWVTEVCDKCGRLLESVRWTRRGGPGEWCSAACRDGIKTAPLKAKSKTCRQCGVSLYGKRADSEFCSDVHRKRFAKSSTPQNGRFIAEMPIGKQGVADAQDGGPMNTLTLSTQAL